MKKYNDNPLIQTMRLTKIMMWSILGIVVSFILMSICIPISFVFGGIAVGIPMTVVLFLCFVICIVVLRVCLNKQKKMMFDMGKTLHDSFEKGFSGETIGSSNDVYEEVEFEEVE
ncbi:MAG: hypothetical protein FWE22_06870 [Firmicutes bacterium]|nr:hypothetical protein [Bacillota bacterium]